MVGCSHARIDEAERTLTMADSLRAAGQAYNDSLRLSEAFQTFRARRLSYSDEYARIGYYYGRHLRAVGDYPAAMQAFIDATHTRSHDYTILGRVYSNMGELCHLATDYALSYIMFDNSAKCFAHLEDSTSYYFALNDMAFELAEQKLIDETIELLYAIEQTSPDSTLLSFVYMTKAILYKNIECHDSTLYYVNRMQALGNNASIGYVTKAQTFWSLSQYDSCIYYAKYVMDYMNLSPREKYNMLYILTYNDSTLNNEQIKHLSEERADIDKEILDPQKQKLILAVELLQQDLSRPYDWRWVYMLIAILALVGTIIGIRYIFVHYRRLRNEKNSFAQSKLISLEQTLATMHNLPTEQLSLELCWRNYDQMCLIVNSRLNGFVDKLSQQYLLLSEKEVRLCILVLVDLSRKQMAELLTYAENGIGKFKYSTAQKMGTTSQNMRTFLIQMIG